MADWGDLFPSKSAGGGGASNPFEVGGLGGGGDLFSSKPAGGGGASDPFVTSFSSGGGALTLPGGQAQGSRVRQRLARIITAYKKGSQSKFSYVFYNAVKEAEAAVRNRIRHPEFTQQQFEQAMQNNPNPRKLVPVMAHGFKDLVARMEQQKKTLAMIEGNVRHVRKTVRKLEDKYIKIKDQEIPAVLQKHAALANRLLKIMGILERMDKKGSSLMQHEVQYMNRLASIKSELGKPNQFRSKIEELRSIVRTQQGTLGGEVNFIDRRNLRQIKKFLAMQGKGIGHIQEILERDRRRVDIIRRGIADKTKSTLD